MDFLESFLNSILSIVESVLPGLLEGLDIQALLDSLFGMAENA